MTAIARLLDENPDIQPRQLEWLPLDLGDPKAVVACVTEMHQREDKLDMLSKPSLDHACTCVSRYSQTFLVNNAGVGLAKFETNDAGWEMTMAVWYVKHSRSLSRRPIVLTFQSCRSFCFNPRALPPLGESNSTKGRRCPSCYCKCSFHQRPFLQKLEW